MTGQSYNWPIEQLFNSPVGLYFVQLTIVLVGWVKIQLTNNFVQFTILSIKSCSVSTVPGLGHLNVGCLAASRYKNSLFQQNN